MAKVLVYNVGKAPVEKEVRGLEDMQKIVKGYIQYVDLGAISGIKELNGYDLYCNEEGKLDGLEPNLLFVNDIVVGNVFISKANEEGETISLTDQDIEIILENLQ